LEKASRGTNVGKKELRAAHENVRATEKKQEVDEWDRGVVEMESTLMSFEHIRDRAQSVIARAQDRHLRDGEMLPGNERKQRRRKRTEDLRYEDDVLSADPIGQMSSRQRESNDWNREDEAD
jgi:hypothetical protein